MDKTEKRYLCALPDDVVISGDIEHLFAMNINIGVDFSGLTEQIVTSSGARRELTELGLEYAMINHLIQEALKNRGSKIEYDREHQNAPAPRQSERFD